MVENVLAVLDGGPGDGIVQETTLKIVHAVEGSVTVLGLSDPDAIDSRQSAPVGAMHYKRKADERRYQELKQSIREQMARLASACEDFGAKSHSVLAESDASSAMAEHWSGKDLIILGRSKRGQGTRFLSRKQLMRVVKDSPCPVIVTSAAEAANPEAVAIAYDGTEEAKQALRHFMSLGLAKERRVEVVCIGHDRETAQSMASTAAALCRTYGVDIETYVVGADRHLLSVLANRLLALRPGSMVLPSVRERGWREIVFGSLTGRLLRNSGATLYLHR